MIKKTNPAINPINFCFLSPTLNEPLKPEPPNQAINGAIIPEILVEIVVSPNEATPAKMANKA